MNREHVEMAAEIRKKLKVAINSIEPVGMKPTDITSLARLANEMERKARIDTIAQDEMRKQLLTDNEGPDLKKAPTKQSDLGEVVNILMKAGALGDIAQLGVRQVETKTTEVVVKNNQGDTSSIELDK